MNPNAITLKTNRKPKTPANSKHSDLVLKKEIKADLRPGKHNIQPGEAPPPPHLAQQGWPRQWSSYTACHVAQPCGPSLSPSTFDGEGSHYLRSSLKPHVQQEARGGVTRSCPLSAQPALLEAYCQDGAASFSPTASGVNRLQLVQEGFPHCHSGSNPISGSCSSQS